MAHELFQWQSRLNANRPTRNLHPSMFMVKTTSRMLFAIMLRAEGVTNRPTSAAPLG